MNIGITRKTAILLLIDIIATYVAYWAASFLTGLTDEVFATNEIYFILGILGLINVAGFALFRLYNNLWEYAGINELLQILLAVLLSTLAGAAFLWIIRVRLPIRVFVTACILLTILMGGVRLLFRIVRQKKRVFRSLRLRAPAHPHRRRRGNRLPHHRPHVLARSADAGRSARGH